MEKYKHKELTDKIIQAFYCVNNDNSRKKKSAQIRIICVICVLKK